MANTYVQFCFKVEGLTPDDFKVLEAVLNANDVDSDAPDWDLSGWDIDWEKDKSSMIVYSEEGGSVEAVVGVLQTWLAETDSPRVIRFTWSYTCDRPIPDAFGGGGVAFNKDEALWVDPDTIIQRWKED